MANRSLHPLLHYLRRLKGGKAEDRALADTQLLHRFLVRHDESAFTTLVQRYGAMVWGLCVRCLGETPEAEDAFQATFLVLVRKAASLRGPQLLGPWLYGVAYRTAMKLRGQRARRAARETPLPEHIAEERCEAVDGDLLCILDDEIHRLPAKYRLPVLLCYVQGLSSEEAAQRLGCAKGTIFSRLSRARDLLRRRLFQRGVEVSAGAMVAVLAENTVLRAAPSLALREMTIRTSVLLAAGTAGQTLSAPLAALVEGVVRSMFLSKVKLVAIVLLAVGTVGSGTGFLAHQTNAHPPSKASPPPAKENNSRIEAVALANAKAKAPAPANPKVLARSDSDELTLSLWGDKLSQSVYYPGLDDARATLADALDRLSKLYGITYLINKRAFRFEQITNPVDPGDSKDQDVARARIADSIAIPPMKASLRTILQTILDRVDLEQLHSEVTFLVRKDHIEITTSSFVRMELGFRNDGPILPLVWDSFEETALAKILPRLAETSGYTIMADPKAGDKLQTKITAQLNNVPIDTAVRLLADMSGMSMVRLDNVFYVTTADNAQKLSEERAKIDADKPAKSLENPKKPEAKRRAK